jgi:hypothetical protein
MLSHGYTPNKCHAVITTRAVRGGVLRIFLLSEQNLNRDTRRSDWPSRGRSHSGEDERRDKYRRRERSRSRDESPSETAGATGN